MPKFSQKSKERLALAHTDLQRLFNEVIKHVDCVVLESERTVEQQEKNVESGVSTTMDSRHLDRPARAVDVAPFPVDWKDTNRFYWFGGYVLGVASQLGIKIRWGGDWDSDHNLKNQSFFDLPHFEVPK